MSSTNYNSNTSIGVTAPHYYQALPMGCYRPESEPRPAKIDSWARGAVPSRPIGAAHAPLSSLHNDAVNPPLHEQNSADEPGKMKRITILCRTLYSADLADTT